MHEFIHAPEDINRGLSTLLTLLFKKKLEINYANTDFQYLDDLLDKVYGVENRDKPKKKWKVPFSQGKLSIEAELKKEGKRAKWMYTFTIERN